MRDAAVQELVYSTRVLDLLGQVRTHASCCTSAAQRRTGRRRSRRFLDAMPHEARRRIAIEHDDRVWTAREALPIAREHSRADVADQLHNGVLPSDPPLDTRELFDAAAPTWHALGLRPKYHVASQKPGAKPGAHDEGISRADWRDVSGALTHPADLMLEAKGKDFVLFVLRRMGAREAAGPVSLQAREAEAARAG